MSSASDRIAAAGPRNAELLATLSRTDYAPAKLKQQKVFISDLQTSLQQVEARISTLGVSVQRDLKQHERYRDSTVKRFAAKMGGKKSQAKFDEKASKGEREYFEAVHAKKTAEDERTMIKEQISDAEKVRSNYQAAVKTHTDAQEELNRLYDGVFAGPTPEFPEEEPKERAVSEAEQRRNEAHERMGRSSQAAQCMLEADKAMTAADQQMHTALQFAMMDVFGGGTFADLAERNALTGASSAAQQSLALVAQAQILDPAILHPGPVDIAQGNLLLRVMFDNVFTDLMFRDMIKQSAMEVQIAHQRILEQRQLQSQRQMAAKGDVDAAEAALLQAREQLQKYRQNAFEQVLAAHSTA